MSFVRTPAGVLMHVDNHRALVEMAKRVGSRGMLAMLEPAEPVRPYTISDEAFAEFLRKHNQPRPRR